MKTSASLFQTDLGSSENENQVAAIAMIRDTVCEAITCELWFLFFAIWRRRGTKTMAGETLKPSLIVNTIEKLNQRIQERFPESGLNGVCGHLCQIAKNMEDRAEWIGRPVTWLRSVTWAVVAIIVIIAILPIFLLMTENGVEVESKWSFEDIVTLTEAGINDVVLIGAAIFFLLTIETRYKRQRALKALHELRSIAHVIDMHQLTKDPHRIMSSIPYARTGQSPRLEMTRFQLRRYLDYCSEMLALTGKIAAVYVQEFDDGVAMASASELETLTTGLSRKIWQKISILHTIEEDSPDAKVQLPNVGNSGEPSN